MGVPPWHRYGLPARNQRLNVGASASAEGRSTTRTRESSFATCSSAVRIGLSSPLDPWSAAIRPAGATVSYTMTSSSSRRPNVLSQLGSVVAIRTWSPRHAFVTIENTQPRFYRTAVLRARRRAEVRRLTDPARYGSCVHAALAYPPDPETSRTARPCRRSREVHIPCANLERRGGPNAMIERADRHRLLQRVFWSPLGLRAIKIGHAFGKRWSSVVLNRSLAPETNGEYWLAELLSAKPMVIDVGFHRGEFAHAVLAARPFARVVGFEPAASIRDIYNGLHAPDPRITIEPLALSSEAGELPFHDDASGNNSLAPIVYTDRTVSYTVRTTTLQAYATAAFIHHIDLLKIDVEGYDLHVLEGAGELLDRQAIDIFLFEYNAPWVLARRFLRDACDYISLKPYHLFRLYNGFLSPFEYTFSAERFDTAAMYVGVSEKRLERGRIPVRAFPD